MKIVVCAKQVPSSEARIQVAADGTSIETKDVEFVVNPYDEYAVEEALQIKESKGGETIALSAGAGSETALRACLNLGIDKAMIIKDDALQGADFLGTAKVLAAALKSLSPDLILLGKLSIDEENSAVGPAVAELMGLPHVAVVSKIEWVDDTTLKVHRDVEGATEVLEVKLPAVLTANKGLNEPRYASLRNIMAAKKKPIEEIDLGGLELDSAAAGAGARKFTIEKLEPPPPRAEGKVLEGEPQEVAAQLIKHLREDAKVL
ncbi:MAG: electron transfer flavoprotein subunit beta [Candidatus Eisenbacteria bacterium]|nr:electron transfer flavoprotein subunit beta [Candidatus Eisenbacteria bacterium]